MSRGNFAQPVQKSEVTVHLPGGVHFTRLNGQTFRHAWHLTHFCPSTCGYSNPSSSAAMLIAPFGQMAKQAVQPQHSSFSLYSIGNSFIVPTILTTPSISHPQLPGSNYLFVFIYNPRIYTTRHSLCHLSSHYVYPPRDSEAPV